MMTQLFVHIKLQWIYSLPAQENAKRIYRFAPDRISCVCEGAYKPIPSLVRMRLGITQLAHEQGVLSTMKVKC